VQLHIGESRDLVLSLSSGARDPLGPFRNDG
jgi:hypothetical protein